ncbi:MAG: sigma-70 family RNA polymerase sigma factor [Deltaproteobacteria bacterium]|nr:sigma-70 family RNA polymerase sigma factor [Deltaproteobacteria bacterium]
MLLSKRGRHDAFEILVERHRVLVFGLATRFLGNKEAGRDVAQDTFLALWAERARYSARGKFRSYLVSMVMHRCHHLVRHQKTRSTKLTELVLRAQDEPLPTEVQLTTLVERERAENVRAALTELPEKCRNVMILRFAHDLPLEEIADVTSMPLGTVKSHIFRGIQRLQKRLRGELA